MGMIDMHAHLSCLSEDGAEELEFRKKRRIITCFSSGTVEEWKTMQQFCDREELLFSFGIHPWYAAQYSETDAAPFFRRCDMIGEIGMDHVWCDVPLYLQKKAFLGQLQLAADLGKPVVLHTKGQEEEIAQIIRDFPGKCLVHWYSGDIDALEKYLDMGCYFTLGPDTADICMGRGRIGNQAQHDARMHLVREVPGDRVFLETDGLSAVAWAKGEDEPGYEAVPAVLWENLRFFARARKTPVCKMAKQMCRNLHEFLPKNLCKLPV